MLRSATNRPPGARLSNAHLQAATWSSTVSRWERDEHGAMTRSNGSGDRQLRMSPSTNDTPSRALSSRPARLRHASSSIGPSRSSPTSSEPDDAAARARGIVTRPLPEASSITRRGRQRSMQPQVKRDVFIVAFVLQVIVAGALVNRFHGGTGLRHARRPRRSSSKSFS